jgi:hypothetical protein
MHDQQRLAASFFEGHRGDRPTLTPFVVGPDQARVSLRGSERRTPWSRPRNRTPDGSRPAFDGVIASGSTSGMPEAYEQLVEVLVNLGASGGRS